MYMKPLHSAEWWTFISVYFFSQNPKCRFILFQYTDVHLCAQLSKVWLSKANNRRKATSSNFDLFLSKAQKQHSTRKLHFSFDQMFYKSSRSTDCAAKNLKTRVHCYATGSTWGLTKRNLKKISIFRAIRLCFLRSLVSAIRSKLIRAPGGAKRDPLARTPSKCWGTCGGARGFAQHVAAANARAEVRARMHDGSIWCQRSPQNRLRDGSLENATCAQGTDRAKLNAAWRGKFQSFRRISSVSRVQ